MVRRIDGIFSAYLCLVALSVCGSVLAGNLPTRKFVVFQESSRVGSHFAEELLQKCPSVWMPVLGRDSFTNGKSTEIVTHVNGTLRTASNVLRVVDSHIKTLLASGSPYSAFGFRCSGILRNDKVLRTYLQNGLGDDDDGIVPILVLRRRQRIAKILSVCVAEEHSRICKSDDWALYSGSECSKNLLGTAVTISGGCLESAAKQEKTLRRIVDRHLLDFRQYPDMFQIHEYYYEDWAYGITKEEQAHQVNSMYRHLGIPPEQCSLDSSHLETKVLKQLVDYSSQISNFDAIKKKLRRLYPNEEIPQ